MKLASPRLLFLGMNSVFSRTVLATLIEQGMRPSLLIMPGFGPAKPHPGLRLIPVATQSAGESLASLAESQGIALHYAPRPDDPETLAVIANLQPDVGLIACYPRKLPAAILRLPRRGFLNLHPSLLPAYRGPNPIYWQLRAGETRTGVTLHVVDDGLDSGPIVAQREVALAAGMSREQIDALMAVQGAGLLRSYLEDYLGGRLPTRPQEEADLYTVIRRRHVGSDDNWAMPIPQLLRQGHAFLGYCFSDSGYLFRGIGAGLGQMLSDRRFAYFAGKQSMNLLEKRLGIYFLSQESSDALTASRCWKDGNDCGIVAIPSKVFNTALAGKRAAVLGFAEGGQVFKYPFLCEPPRLDEIAYLIVSSSAKARYERLLGSLGDMQSSRPGLIAFDWQSSGVERGSMRDALAQCLLEAGVSPATPVPANSYPGTCRSKL